MQGKDILTLWILVCRLSEKWDTLFTFYARDREHAERRAAELLKEHLYERLELKEYPYGFRIVTTTLPGKIEGSRTTSEGL
jgi:hypothetical protein